MLNMDWVLLERLYFLLKKREFLIEQKIENGNFHIHFPDKKQRQFLHLLTLVLDYQPTTDLHSLLTTSDTTIYCHNKEFCVEGIANLKEEIRLILEIASDLLEKGD